jgi:hypothetical protein
MSATQPIILAVCNDIVLKDPLLLVIIIIIILFSKFHNSVSHDALPALGSTTWVIAVSHVSHFHQHLETHRRTFVIVEKVPIVDLEDDDKTNNKSLNTTSTRLEANQMDLEVMICIHFLRISDYLKANFYSLLDDR